MKSWTSIGYFKLNRFICNHRSSRFSLNSGSTNRAIIAITVTEIVEACYS